MLSVWVWQSSCQYSGMVMIVNTTLSKLPRLLVRVTGCQLQLQLQLQLQPAMLYSRTQLMDPNTKKQLDRYARYEQKQIRGYVQNIRDKLLLKAKNAVNDYFTSKSKKCRHFLFTKFISCCYLESTMLTYAFYLQLSFYSTTFVDNSFKRKNIICTSDLCILNISIRWFTDTALHQFL